MKPIFVTGTDTGVGKTVVCGLLARYFLNKGHSVITQKWIQTGSAGLGADIAEHLKFMDMTKSDIAPYLSDMAPYVFKFPASAHLAAAIGKKKIDPEKIKQGLNRLSRRFDVVIIEGIGGVLVPLNKKEMLIDMVRRFSLPVIIVVKNKLGAINHTLLTIEALKSRRIKILGVIFNNPSRGTEQTILRNNPEIVKSLSGERILGVLPWTKNRNNLYKTFEPIGAKVLAGFKG